MANKHKPQPTIREAVTALENAAQFFATALGLGFQSQDTRDASERVLVCRKELALAIRRSYSQYTRPTGLNQLSAISLILTAEKRIAELENN